MNIFLLGSVAFDRVGQFNGKFSDLIDKDHLDKLSLSLYVEDQKCFLGGTSGNIAYSLGLLGIEAFLLGVIGDDGDQYLEKLSDWGMNFDSLIRISGPCPNANIITDLAQNQITFFAPGVIANEIPDFKIPDFAKAGDVLLVTPENTSRMKTCIEDGKNKGMTVFFDPGQQIHTFSPENIREVIELSDGMFVNDYEWELIKSISGFREDELFSKLELIVHTKGENGVDIIINGDLEHLDAVKVDNVGDPTGAGDAFRGGFIAAYTKGLSPVVCGRIGTILGSLSVQTDTTQGHVISDKARAELKNLGFSFANS